ncbi:helix-turn-helix domain-containing protein [Burkholderia ubonensis]|uniref:helix-turn-helix domain-containing protein n=1 Tax=Burkholderia ubonensis TaxID=101571 RepID=UPI001E40CD63|nr:helix-turn-helix transcriptional regulator [Burkholderia ubonensis]
MLAIASPATYAWTDIVSGPYIENGQHGFSHTFYVSGVWPSKGQAWGQAHMECVQDNSFEDRFRGSCKSIATFDGPAVIALVTAQNQYWSAYADPDTDTAVRKAMALCHKDKADECQLTNIYWDFGHNFLDAPETFKQPASEDATARVIANVKRLRGEAGFSQEALSVKAHRFRTYVGRLENGGASPMVVDLQDLADALGVSISSLLKTEILSGQPIK